MSDPLRRILWLAVAAAAISGLALGAVAIVSPRDGGAPVAAPGNEIAESTSSTSPSPSPSPSVSASPSRSPFPTATCGKPGARLVRFRVLVERGLEMSRARLARELMSVLCDSRSWIASGKVRFRYDPEGALLIGLRTPSSSERRCLALVGQSVRHYYSCGTRREVVLNSDRWFTGSKYWPGPAPEYRKMLVNHEVGHALGQHHRSCPGRGKPAPVMMQQSKGVGVCTRNPWPLRYELRSLRG